MPSSDDGLEELGDEVIIAQETGAHAPQPRVQVATDHPTVVISEPPAATRDTRRRTRSRGEQTVVIRDRKKLEEMRRALSGHPPRRLIEPRTVLLLGAAALASLALGTLVAVIMDAQAQSGSPTVVAPAVQPPRAGSAPSAADPPPIDLDALPDPPRKPRRADTP